MAEGDKYEGFSLALAVVDGVPVLAFGASCVILGMLFRSPLFIAGSCLCFLAGFLKVLWKVLLAVSKKDISLLNRQFRCLMPAGFGIIILSLVLGAEKISIPGIISAATAFPSVIFFALWICGMAAMGALAKRLDSSDVKSNWIEQGVNGAAQLCLLAGLLFLL